MCNDRMALGRLYFLYCFSCLLCVSKNMKVQEERFKSQHETTEARSLTQMIVGCECGYFSFPRSLEKGFKIRDCIWALVYVLLKRALYTGPCNCFKNPAIFNHFEQRKDKFRCDTCFPRKSQLISPFFPFLTFTSP